MSDMERAQERELKLGSAVTVARLFRHTFLCGGTVDSISQSNTAGELVRA
jgi:hypothetical protein